MLMPRYAIGFIAKLILFPFSILSLANKKKMEASLYGSVVVRKSHGISLLYALKNDKR